MVSVCYPFGHFYLSVARKTENWENRSSVLSRRVKIILVLFQDILMKPWSDLFKTKDIREKS